MWNKLNKSMMFCQMMFGLSFYGVMVILTRFFLEELNYSEADTMMVVGAFSSIGPLFAIAGGFIADKFLGAYRSLTISYLGFSVGYALLVLGSYTTNVPMALCGIALASYGRGLMSPSYPSLYKRTFDTQEHFENCYPVNYSVNNVGALLGQYLFPMFVLVLGFHGSFMLSAILAFFALATLVIFRKSLLTVGADIDQQPVSSKKWAAFLVTSTAMIALVFFMFSNMDIGQNIVYAIGLAAIGYFIFLMIKSEKSDALKMGTILIVTALTTAFFVYYGQMMTSMTMVTINTMRGDLFNLIPIAPEASMAMNPLWCIVAGPIIAMTFSALEKRDIHFSTATKIGFAFILTAIAFGILTMAVMSVGEDVIIRPEVFLLIHFFQAFAEVIVGSLVVAFILSVAPKHIEGFSVSLFSVAMALSGIIGAVFSTSIAQEKGQVITQEFVQTVYGGYFQLLTILAVVMVAVAFIASFIIRKMLESSKHAETAELKEQEV
ncbi:peptide MFS transporter [Aliivibrio sp. S4TY2]|uniref:peptide MFS transporter n=1 Tax=unclassified Aliivibrio TaxID=2645654 RepID=UPI002378166A|nr:MULTISPECIES: peptide MFS transporter [unclassified Aliivibrio]MDD9155272.1 peptide MFS transporter [Aliivibrio sp. S4TY2]MDD9159176.1 peptide MFS transporter [Aliivibrio sp. S4TY1]MDD9163274.1 peptide MFS transporter [Aliivibrio sp. S4MY2]MDD9167175.1 peptide MFS transporter [Aliivibrio sp. S4MY4]MDD9184351.1 peptide MFS transporter [Aliivibrio sp. S4MY3]